MERAEVDLDRDAYCVMGLPIDAVDMQGAVQRVRDAAFGNRSCVIATPNLNFVMMARDDDGFRNSVLHSDLVLADGMPLVWVARLLGLPIRERVSGAGLFENLLAHPGPPVTIYFFGGPEGAAVAACKRVNDKDCGLRCVGFDSPGFGTIEDMSTDEHIARVNGSGAQFVIVSLGAKKGQAWIDHNRTRLTAPVICHLGAVVNFAAGTVRRAPQWMQQLGAEWLWRIWEEPKLWRRYWEDGSALLTLMRVGVLPLALILRFRSAGLGEHSPPTVDLTQCGSQVVLSVRGTWGACNLQPLRNAFTEARRTSCTVVLRLEAVTIVDTALVAFVQLARTLPSVAVEFADASTSPLVSRVFQRCGVSSL